MMKKEDLRHLVYSSDVISLLKDGETIETKDFDHLHDFVIEQRGYIWLKNTFVIPLPSK